MGQLPTGGKTASSSSTGENPHAHPVGTWCSFCTCSRGYRIWIRPDVRPQGLVQLTHPKAGISTPAFSYLFVYEKAPNQNGSALPYCAARVTQQQLLLCRL